MGEVGVVVAVELDVPDHTVPGQQLLGAPVHLRRRVVADGGVREVGELVETHRRPPVEPGTRGDHDAHLLVVDPDRRQVGARRPPVHEGDVQVAGPHGPHERRRVVRVQADVETRQGDRAQPAAPGGAAVLALVAKSVAVAALHATNSLNGRSGPWVDRVGFDQTAGAFTGIADLEGGGGAPRLSPVLVVDDYIVSWLAAAGVVAALGRRAREGGRWAVHVSLSRVALWIIELGVFDLGYAREIAGTGPDHAYLDPETFTADTPLGHHQGVTDQVRMSATPDHYRHVLLPAARHTPGG